MAKQYHAKKKSKRLSIARRRKLALDSRRSPTISARSTARCNRSRLRWRRLCPTMASTLACALTSTNSTPSLKPRNLNMATDRNPEILALWAQVDDATNAIADRIQSDIDDGVTAENVDAFVAKMQAHVARLKVLGSNPDNPIPPVDPNAPSPQARNANRPR